MCLKLLGCHVRARRVELCCAVEATDARQPCVLDSLGEGLGLDGELCDGVEV